MAGADGGTDRNLIIADVKIDLKRIKRTKLPPKYDDENISDEHTVDVENRFRGLQLKDREPGELWNDIRQIVKDTADKKLSNAKRKKFSKWLSDEAEVKEIWKNCTEVLYRRYPNVNDIFAETGMRMNQKCWNRR